MWRVMAGGAVSPHGPTITPSTNHNLPHRQVMTQVMPPDLFLMLGERSNCGLVEHLM